MRARINERIDWFNTGFYRDLGYGVIYPQIFQHYTRPEPIRTANLAWGRDKARRWLGILDQHILGANRYVCGDTFYGHFVAAYREASFVTV